MSSSSPPSLTAAAANGKSHPQIVGGTGVFLLWGDLVNTCRIRFARVRIPSLGKQLVLKINRQGMKIIILIHSLGICTGSDTGSSSHPSPSHRSSVFGRRDFNRSVRLGSRFWAIKLHLLTYAAV